MRKIWKVGIGCLGSMLLTGIILIVVFYVVARPKLAPRADANLVLIVELGIREFIAEHPDQVPEEGDNAAWAILLRDQEMEGASLPFSWITLKGRFISLMNVPLKIETTGLNEVSVVAASADGKIDTDDDIDFDRAMEIMASWESEMREKRSE